MSLQRTTSLPNTATNTKSQLAPQYLGENSPKSIRGSLTAFYNLMIVMSLCLAFWVNYGVGRWKGNQSENNLQWKLAMAIQIIPGGFMFLMMFFVIDTPRALIANGKREKGLENLCKLRGLSSDHPYVREEFLEVSAQVDAQLELAAGNNYKQVIKDIFLIASNRRRFFLASMLFLFHKVRPTTLGKHFWAL